MGHTRASLPVITKLGHTRVQSAWSELNRTTKWKERVELGLAQMADINVTK